MSTTSVKLWTEDIAQLFAFNRGMWPRSDATPAANLNAITRLGLAACLLLAVFDPSLATVTFIAIVVAVMVAYYASSGSKGDAVVLKESYEDVLITSANDIVFRDPTDPSSFNDATAKRFCNDFEPIQFDEDYFSRNQYLVGCPNPKTLVPPIIAPPSHDLAYWKASDLTTHSRVNDQTSYDAYSAGYVGPAYNFSTGYSGYAEPISTDSYRPSVCSDCVRAPCVCAKPITRSDLLTTQTVQPGLFEQSDYTEPINSNIGITYTKQFDPTRVKLDDVGLIYSAMPAIPPDDDFPQYPPAIGNSAPPGRRLLIGRDPFYGGVYSPPVQNPALPYFYVDAIAPPPPVDIPVPQIPNFPPAVTVEPFVDRIERSGATFTGCDAIAPYPPPIVQLQTESDVYDPRFTGYGPTERGYVEPTTGQPRFFYDDIDAVTMPNFISRNAVDVYPWAAQYGSGYNGNLSVDGIAYGDGYKRLAENAFADSAIQFRTEMQERLMRKRNAEMWQLRFAPIYTSN